MVSGAPVPRRRTPVVCIAYGEPGLAWLRALRRRCVDNPNVAGLVERDVVQFWCVGAAASGVEGVRMFKEVPTFVVASEVLAGARTARVMAECPGLSVHSITVMERVSLFEEGIAELRQRVRDVLEAVPEYANLGSTGQSGFAYDWIALADSLHEPARVTPEMRAAAGRAARVCAADTRTFLADRLDTNVAVIDHDLATRCLLELATAFVNGDLGAPRDDGVSASVPDGVARAREDSVIPFSIAVLEHPWHEIERARVEAFLLTLASGVSSPEQATRVFGSPSLLIDTLKADVAALDANGFDRHLRRMERDQAAHAAVAWALAVPQSSLMRDVLVSLKREIPSLLGRPTGAPTYAAASSPGLLLLIQAPAEAIRPEFLFAALAGAVALVGGVVLWRRSRRPQGDIPAVAAAHVALLDLRHDIVTEWEQLCLRLTAFMDHWQPIARGLTTTPVPQPGVAPWRSAPPIGWRLTSGARLANDVPITPELCLELGRRIVGEWHEGAEMEVIVGNTARHELMRWDERRGTRGNLLGEVLQAAMAVDQSRVLRSFIDARPYLVNASPPPVRDSVLWLSAPAIGIGDQLRALESAAARDATIALSHDDDSCSVRFTFARPVTWPLITSLAFTNDGR